MCSDVTIRDTEAEFHDGAMLSHNPIHKYLFDNKGKLLVADEAALAAAGHTHEGDPDALPSE